MKGFIYLLAEIVNLVHDVLLALVGIVGLEMNDKQLHFWVIGCIGIVLFLLVHVLFKWMATWSITMISLTFSFTVILVLVFAIEIQQGITNRGNMDFQDALYGIYGFLAFFVVFLLIKGLRHLFKRTFRD